MLDQGAGAPSSRDRLSVCIVACKDLHLNMRTMRQARSLTEAGHRVTIVAFEPPDARLATSGAETSLIATGTPHYPAPLMTRLWLTRLLRDETAQRSAAAKAVASGRTRGGLFAARAARCLSGASFDVVQAHFDRALIAASHLARRSGAKVVFDSVEVPFDAELLPGGATARAVRLAEIERECDIARRADGWITINDSLAEAAVARFGIARPLVLRNCQEDKAWPADGRLRRDLGLGADARILLHLNTMRAGEGVETAIDALALLPTAFHLVVLGPVPQRAYLKTMRRRAARCGVAHRFHVAPMQPPHALLGYIAGADIGVIARQGNSQNMHLSLPNRLFQMIAVRLPIVATPLPEIARVVREWGLGFVVEESDPLGLADAIRGLSDGAAVAEFRAAADRAARALTWEREGMKYVEFIERLAGVEPLPAAAPDGIDSASAA